jgi:microtubule-associated protein-like 6
MEEVEEGEQFMAVKPFEGQVRAMVPTGFKPGPRSNEAPTEELKLKYIHGYRCFDCKNTAKWTKDNTTDVVFVSAALGVKMNTAKRPFTQQFFNMHDEDLICFDTHPTLNYACSGQMAAKGKSLAVDIFVWDCDTMQVVSHLVSKAKGSICQVKFSNDGEKLLSIRTDENNSVSIWDWKNQRLISTAKVDAAAVIDICWD